MIKRQQQKGIVQFPIIGLVLLVAAAALLPMATKLVERRTTTQQRATAGSCGTLCEHDSECGDGLVCYFAPAAPPTGSQVMGESTDKDLLAAVVPSISYVPPIESGICRNPSCPIRVNCECVGDPSCNNFQVGNKEYGEAIGSYTQENPLMVGPRDEVKVIAAVNNSSYQKGSYKLSDGTNWARFNMSNGTGTFFAPIEEGIYQVEVNAYDTNSCSKVCTGGGNIYTAIELNQCLTEGNWINPVGGCGGCRSFIKVDRCVKCDTNRDGKVCEDDLNTIDDNYQCTSGNCLDYDIDSNGRVDSADYQICSNSRCRSSVATCQPNPTPTSTGANCDNFTSNWTIESITPEYTNGEVAFVIEGNFPKIDDCGARSASNHSMMMSSQVGLSDRRDYNARTNMFEYIREDEIKIKPLTYDNETRDFYLWYCQGTASAGECSGSSRYIRFQGVEILQPTPTDQFKPCSSCDTNEDGKVCRDDLELFTSCYGQTDPISLVCARLDMNRDGVINALDASRCAGLCVSDNCQEATPTPEPEPSCIGGCYGNKNNCDINCMNSDLGIPCRQLNDEETVSMCGWPEGSVVYKCCSEPVVPTTIPTEEPQPTIPSEEGGCGDVCTTNDDCASGYCHARIGNTGICRNSACPELASCDCGGISPTEQPARCRTCTSGTAKNRGNANCDGRIDMADFVIWKYEYIANRANREDRNDWDADFDCDQRVTIGDLVNFWKIGFMNR